MTDAGTTAASRDRSPHDEFERRLAREILVSERLRATLLAILPTVAMLAFLATRAIAGVRVTPSTSSSTSTPWSRSSSHSPSAKIRP